MPAAFGLRLFLVFIIGNISDFTIGLKKILKLRRNQAIIEAAVHFNSFTGACSCMPEFRGIISMNQYGKHKTKSRLAAMLAAALLAGTLQGCALPDGFSGIVRPVEEAVSTVRKNIELRQQLNALELPKEVEGISQDRYAYGTLPQEHQVIYNQMLDAIMNHDEEVTLSTEDGQELEQIFNCIKADYGGLFWVESFRYTQYQRNGQTEAMSFAPNYIMTKQERERMQKKIDRRADAYLEEISPDASDYEKVRDIYRMLIQKTDYNLDAENNQNIISVFVGRETVCQGYASAMQYLMDRLDIPCIIVTGTARGGPHAWNLVQLEGEWYYVDVTWGNSKYHDDKKNDVKYVEYDYLNITTEEMLKDHSPQAPFELPQCTSMEQNYYVKEGRYFTSLDEETLAEAGAVFKRAYEKGRKHVSVKFSTREQCQQAKEYFLTQYHISDYCRGLETVYYKTDLQMNIFVVIFP